MDDLIEALNIFNKYFKGDKTYPTHCEHDVLMINPRIGQFDIPDDEVKRLKELSFSWSATDYCWTSYKFGSS